MLTARPLPWLLAALLVTAALHCACGHEVVVSSDGMPHKHCHNEFGCICQGATLVESVDLDAGNVQFDWPTQGVASLEMLPALSMTSTMLSEVATPPPLAGRALRAVLASLVI